jgi:hypothetical protein
MAHAIPIGKGSKEETFTALAANFGLNGKVKNLFLNGHMENLEDFRHYFADEEEIDAFVAMGSGWAAPELMRQTSIVKHAWRAIRRSGLHKECCNTVSSTAQFNNGLEEVTLKEAQVQFLDRGSKEATFTAMSVVFGFDDKTRNLFLKGPMDSLADFRYYFTDEKEIDAFVTEGESLRAPGEKLRISRVRQAWTAVRQNGLHIDDCNTASSVAGPNDLLGEATLRQVKVQFWRRYKSTYPVEVLPSDQLLSRCYREIDKRLLTVCDIRKVENLLHQIMTTRKRKMPGTDLCTTDQSCKNKGRCQCEWQKKWQHQRRWQQPENFDADKYLATLHTYLLALAIAGSGKMQGAPTEEAFGTDPTKFVEVPWDVLQAYHLRASRAVMLVPEASRLAWLEARDIMERSVWASRFREGRRSLGQVVQSVTGEMGYHWDTSNQGMAELQAAATHPLPDGPGQFRPGKGPLKRIHYNQRKRERRAMQQPTLNKTVAQIAPTSQDGRMLHPGLNNGIPHLQHTHESHDPNGLGLAQAQPCPNMHTMKNLKKLPSWSLGAAEYHTGDCTPCQYFWKKRGCHKGRSCDFCHTCSEQAVKNYWKTKRGQRLRQRRQIIDAATATAAGSDGKSGSAGDHQETINQQGNL